MPRPHKHAEVIKAWADGAEIECRVDADDTWGPAAKPLWDTDSEYRVKPPPFRVYVWATVLAGEIDCTQSRWCFSKARFDHARDTDLGLVCTPIVEVELERPE